VSEQFYEMPEPIRFKVERGAPLTVNQWISWFVVRPLMEFRRRSRETPKLRERCVEYVIRTGATGSWNIAREAQELSDYITRGQR